MKLFKRIEITPLFMNHWGYVHLLPVFDISVTYSTPTFQLAWLVFRLDITIYRRLPNWFMNTIWNWINFDFIKKKEEEYE